MRHGRGAGLVGWSVAAAALIGLLVASSASAVTASSVALKVKVTGSGTLRVNGEPGVHLRCHPADGEYL